MKTISARGFAPNLTRAIGEIGVRRRSQFFASFSVFRGPLVLSQNKTPTGEHALTPARRSPLRARASKAGRFAHRSTPKSEVNGCPLLNPRFIPHQAAFVQSCQERPSTRLNSETFAVIMVAPILSAWAAINKSKGPIGLPALSSVARRSPAVLASCSSKGNTPMSADRNTRNRSAFSLRRSLRATPYQSSYKTTDETAIDAPSDRARRRRSRTLAG